jgi:2-aminoethylphosphonate-pyruvate transaminase
MLSDAGSWHDDFNALVGQVRESLLSLAGVSKDEGYEAVLVQGSGSYGVEAAVTSAVPRDGCLLVVSNGAYGARIMRSCERAGIEAEEVRYSEDTPARAADVRDALATSRATHVIVVHVETTTGIVNPIDEIGRAAKDAGRVCMVDAISSFGAMPINQRELGIDYLISSANKCIEGVPGFSFVLARRAELEASEGRARSYALDLVDQWRGFERNGQFRFTPPTHVVLAFAQALRELAQEGGVKARAARYERNHAVLMEGMASIGFRPYLHPDVQSYIITSFHYPTHPAFAFDRFYRGLSDRGLIIYPGKLTDVPCFRIGTIGRLFEADIRQLLSAMRETLDDMGIDSGA